MLFARCAVVMSALGQERTLSDISAMSALLPMADIGTQPCVLLCAKSGHHLATSHPPDDGLSDVVRRIFLNEMGPLDCHLSLRRQASGVFENLAAGEDSAGLGLQEQLGHTARLQPVRVG